MSSEVEKRGREDEFDGAPIAKRKRTTASSGKLAASEFAKLVQGPVVTILVGPNKREFTLPKALAEYYSPVLERAFNGRFKEAAEQTIQFPEEDPHDMELVLQWIYNDGTARMNESNDSNKGDAIGRWIDF